MQKASFTNRVDPTLEKTANYGRMIDKQRENEFWLLGGYNCLRLDQEPTRLNPNIIRFGSKIMHVRLTIDPGPGLAPGPPGPPAHMNFIMIMMTTT